MNGKAFLLVIWALGILSPGKGLRLVPKASLAHSGRKEVFWVKDCLNLKRNSCGMNSV